MPSVTTLRRGRQRWAGGLAGSLVLAALAWSVGPAAADVAPGNVPYDGRLVVFVRLRYDMARSLAGGFFRQDVKWAHDYPRAERNLTKILEAVTHVNPFQGPNGGNVLALDDPELHKFPFAYMSEPGFWYPTDAEVLGLRNYMLKGGFVVFDDFWGDHWRNFDAQLQRVLPGARPLPMELDHPVFQSFFDIETLEMPGPYGPPVEFHGVFEDNDPSGRLMAIVNFNNDIGEYWEFSNTGVYSVDLTNEAYKFGVNYVVYALTH